MAADVTPAGSVTTAAPGVCARSDGGPQQTRAGRFCAGQKRSRVAPECLPRNDRIRVWQRREIGRGRTGTRETKRRRRKNRARPIPPPPPLFVSVSCYQSMASSCFADNERCAHDSILAAIELRPSRLRESARLTRTRTVYLSMDSSQGFFWGGGVGVS